MSLELRGITKRFPGVLANDHVDLTVREGEILGLLGENGAGKTTLMNILYGLYTADEGEIIIDGEVQHFTGPGDAIAAGIGMVHQHFMLVPVMTVAENVVLGVEPVKRDRFPFFGAILGVAALILALAIGFGWFPEGTEVGYGAVIAVAAVAGMVTFLTWDTLRDDEARQDVIDISTQYGLQVDPDAVIEDLPVGIQQRVEIIKVLFREARFLVFDEPTAVLTPQEVEDFFRIVRSLKEANKGIIFITHKLGEVLEIADRINVLRRGAVVGEALPGELTQEQLAELMVGRPVDLTVHKEPAKPGPPMLTLENVVVVDEFNKPAIDHVSFTVHGGEIVGIAGVQGNGQTELVEGITGLREILSGTVRIGDVDVTADSPREIHEAGVAHVPEDRQRRGLVLSFTVAENMVLDSYHAPPFSRGVVMDWEAVEEHASRLVEEFDVRTPSIDVPVSNLSGGNQQKVIVAREFGRPVKAAVAAQPTRGLDVGSIEYIHERMVAERDTGAGILVVSTELDEIMALSDRILVLYRGKIVAEVKPEETTNTELGLYMAGGRPA